ncbi:unnamed protein product [Ilex paraguariensis]|uniref:Histone H2A n=1 Tax=Ilex paraguariensis TaxID=185542 RepID=A0ABC8UNR0_9AQUA
MPSSSLDFNSKSLRGAANLGNFRQLQRPQAAPTSGSSDYRQRIGVGWECSKDNKKNCIVPRHIQLGVRNDEELGRFLCGFHFPN